MNVDGSNQTNIVNNPSESDWHPSISPDGSQIVFVSRRHGNHEIFVMNLDGTQQVRLTERTTTGFHDNWPVWSPDGTKIVLDGAVKKDGKSGFVIFTMTTSGDNLTPVSDVIKVNPAFSNDNNYSQLNPDWFQEQVNYKP